MRAAIVNGQGPAYPSHGTMGEVVNTGLSKRELFAAMAMQGILARGTMGEAHTRAETAVDHADALLAELERTA